MTPEKTISVLENYIHQINALGYKKSERLDPKVTDATRPEQLRHLRFMCEETIRFVEQSRMEKAFRWLGFIQGALWVLGIFAVEEMKNHNKPSHASSSTP